MFPMARPAKLQTCAYFPFFFACPFLPILLIDSKPILDILLVPYSLKKHSVPIPKKKMFLMKTHLGGITSSSFQNIFSRKHCPLFKATLLPKDHFIQKQSTSQEKHLLLETTTLPQGTNHSPSTTPLGSFIFSLLLLKPSLPKGEVCFLRETLHEETLLLPCYMYLFHHQYKSEVKITSLNHYRKLKKKQVHPTLMISPWLKLFHSKVIM